MHQSILPSVSFDPRSLQNLTNPMTLFYYIWLKTVSRKMKRRGEKRVGAGREKSPSFAKITEEMIQ